MPLSAISIGSWNQNNNMQGDTLPMTDWDLNKERAMASRAKILRDRMTEARMAEELCLHHTCGNKALMPSVVN